MGVLVRAGYGNDTITGGPGDDKLDGEVGNGRDWLYGGGQIDVLRAVDGEADRAINGGNGTDTVHFDAGLDPAPTGVEVSN